MNYFLSNYLLTPAITIGEVVRAALRLLEEEENRVIALKEAIKEGIESGIATDFEPLKHLAKLKASKNKNA